ncbi:NADPH-dependent F420 reductase [Halocatena pleomorpha]|uniref:NADPH-dependent F420 reductase n=1 Tax=Halocatena pleomorpha TaxID=1785090 RepID=A0A3P3R9G1_9EURY|nr:NADPH-dependent F420 reductase [Halocatena pleomorpha]RRJ30076.1 NADPH-dependent F420 reductase [Halocatena pleomorpha]
MDIALLGGTGDIGEGLALRWAQDTDHTVVVGSRDSEKATRRADDYGTLLGERGVEHNVVGMGNEAATARADVVVLSVPPEYAISTVETVSDGLTSDDVLVSPAVSMDRDGAGFHATPPEDGSVAQAIAAVAPEDVPVVGAFQSLAAGALSDLDTELRTDTVVTGDDPEATALVRSLADAIEGLRALEGGPLAVTALVESVTPLLINLAMNNEGMHDLGVRFQ